jgi:hypothetical protein
VKYLKIFSFTSRKGFVHYGNICDLDILRFHDSEDVDDILGCN